MKAESKKGLFILVFFIISSIRVFAKDQDIRDKELTVKLNQLMDSYQYSQACLLADHLLEKDSLNLELLILKGRALAADFKAQDAKDVFIRAYLLDSANTVTLFELVNVCRQLGDFRQAIA